MKLAFFGSAEFSLPTLKLLCASTEFEVCLVITKPDQPAGRGLKLTPTPVKKFALEQGLTVLDKIPEAAKLKELAIEKIVVVAYGLFIPAEIFNNWPCINLHPSLLPKYRGASPLQSALLNGETKSGISTMFVAEKMDAGDILLQQEIEIPLDLDIQNFHDLCAEKGAELVKKTLLSDLEKIRKKQEENQATFCKKIEKDDRQIFPGEDPLTIHNKVRAITGFIELANGKRVKILKTNLIPGKAHKYELEIITVQPEGKPPMPYSEYLKGHAKINLSQDN